MTYEYIIEYAPTPRSKCHTCYTPILLSSLRLGCLDSYRPHWRHWSCVPARAISRVKDSGAEFKSSMQWLKERDYKMVDQDLKRGWILGKEDGVSRKRIRKWERDDGADARWKGKETEMGRGRVEWKGLGGEVKKTGLAGKKEGKGLQRGVGRRTRNSMRAAGMV